MAEDAPVTAPPETAEKLEPTPAEESVDKAPENPSSIEDKPTENANVTGEKKEAEAADRNAVSEEATDAKDNKDNGDDAADAAEPENAAETNGTPASTKKSAKDRRRSSGVGEKKLNRKKSMPRITQMNAKPGEYYLARLRSYAPWPAIICDEEMLPSDLLETRPVTAMQEDGTYREDYADGGKRAHERTFPVMFFGTNQFAWIVNSNLTPLTPAEAKDVSEKNKSKSLLGAYQIAAEGNDLAYFKNLLAEHENAIQKELEEEEKKEAEKAKAKAEKAEKAEKNKKTKRKSKGAETDVEMEDAEDTKKPKSSAKKRKNDADGETEKPAKTPKTATKIKLSTPKAPAEEKTKTPASKTKKAAPKKGKAAAAASEEEASTAKESEKTMDPEEQKKKKEKEVLFLRHKLQKGFISRDQPPKEDEMATMASYFDKLEKHADLEVSIIRSTKINKVLKMIVKLNTIPRDEDFGFRPRAMKILSNWKAVLDSDAPGDGAKSTANGAKDEDAADTPKLETEEEKEPETKTTNDDTPMPDAEAESKEETDKVENKEQETVDEPATATDEKPAEEKEKGTTEASA
ncbi:hypothetical protein N7532_010450 [Penicillium argentinense]|uniref:PWWP domain-containing protein n=1 Tax=Penicillium argentinense TaxID=1131581 RepID=A0A9W9JXN5_9EURO|nr:uncharacterized protein N7532_010450 [Penicillium argentinense]KAJ5085679.1 hypothetical protein N7532_010450 [Penicillium argentinense]